MNGIEPWQTESQCSYRLALVATRRTPSRKIESTHFYNSPLSLTYERYNRAPNIRKGFMIKRGCLSKTLNL